MWGTADISAFGILLCHIVSFEKRDSSAALEFIPPLLASLIGQPTVLIAERGQIADGCRVCWIQMDAPFCIGQTRQCLTLLRSCSRQEQFMSSRRTQKSLAPDRRLHRMKNMCASTILPPFRLRDVCFSL
jgi:hypothetical protein